MNSVRPLAIALLLLLAGCALSPMLPPLNRGLLSPSPSGRNAATKSAPYPAGPPERYTGKVDRDFNAAEGVIRLSTTTHAGAYFLWVQRPRVTFVYVYEADRPVAPPTTVYLVIRSQSPRIFRDNHLTLTCQGIPAAVGGVPTSRLAPSVFTDSHFLTFALSRDEFESFAGCRSGTVAVGGVEASFEEKHFEALRALAAGWQAAIE